MSLPRIKHYLVNEKNEDPALVIEVETLGEYLLFDVGNIYKLDRHLIKKINRIFITHTHMDHFIGFDYLLRNKLGKAHSVDIFGINPLVDNVYCKLQGYTWNLIEFEPQIIFHVKQLNESVFEYYSLDLKKRFAKDFIKNEKADTDIIFDHPFYRVRYAVLDHKIWIMGYSFEYKDRLLFKKEKIKELPLKGKEFGILKEWLSDERNKGKKFKVGDKFLSYEYLKDEYTYIQRGIKISYITDVLYSPENKRKIIELVKNSDVLYCEAPFLEEDEEQASKVYHLTSKQAAEIAKEANVKKLVVFHFSRRYGKNTDKILEQVRKYFPDAE